MKIITLFISLLLPTLCYAQLGFCPGSKGDPIFHEDFGEGLSTGPPLAATTTNYNYVTVDPNDGEYTISGRIGQYNGSWHNSLPATTLSQGKALIVNADFTSGLFYTIPISGLCENTSYEFSAFLMNIYNPSSGVCHNGGIPINVRFEIWDSANTTLLKSGSTGDIISTNIPKWQQYALTFQSGPGQGTIILKMYNNGVGGCGNDLAIDDIVFRSCGDLTKINTGEDFPNPYVFCESSPQKAIELTANPDNSIYNTHFFQWQESNDGNSWSNLPGETQENYVISEIFSSKFYRVKVSEDEINLNNNLCSTASDVFEIKYLNTPLAPISGGNKTACSNEEIPFLSVTAKEGEVVNWYDSAIGGNLLLEGSLVYKPDTPGTYYAEALNLEGCSQGPRTAVVFTSFFAPEVTDEILEICETGEVLLDAGIANVKYEWSTGETGREILISTPGNYWVKLNTDQGCLAEKKFEVTGVVKPEISEIISEERGITILTAQEGNFEYSLDGINYQNSNFFTPSTGGVYTAFVRDLSLCSTVSSIFPYIIIQKYFSPNNDGYNDLFEFKGVEFFPSSHVRIFDRYGKLLKTGNAVGFSWDGTYEGKTLPADDYWYEIYIEDYKELKGHISLVR